MSKHKEAAAAAAGGMAAATTTQQQQQQQQPGFGASLGQPVKGEAGGLKAEPGVEGVKADPWFKPDPGLKQVGGRLWRC
jgi:hypothetical protein